MSDIFSFIDIQILAIAFFVLLVWNIVLSFKLFKPNGKSDVKVSPDTDSGETGEAAASRAKTIEETRNRLQSIESSLKENKAIAAKGIQNIGVVRFNPFKDVGGDQSFAIALLDSSGNGLTISSLYSREGTRVYAKPIKNNASPYQLSGEEKEAVSGAMGKVSSK